MAFENTAKRTAILLFLIIAPSFGTTAGAPGRSARGTFSLMRERRRAAPSGKVRQPRQAQAVLPAVSQDRCTGRNRSDQPEIV